jgi:LL-diaminopimelate aminotransferase
MTGWRIGYIVGNREIIEKLMVVKTNFDSGQFAAIQNAGITALKYGDAFVEEMRNVYNLRRHIVFDAFIKKGIHIYRSEGAFYCWFKVPGGYTSQEFASLILEKTGVIITPGDTFGSNGEGYCRISLTVNKEKIETAMGRIEALDL